MLLDRKKSDKVSHFSTTWRIMSGKRLTLPFRFASVKCGHTRMVMVVNQPNVVPLDRDVWTSYVLWSPHGERLVSYDGLTWPGTLSYDGVTWNLELRWCDLEP